MARALEAAGKTPRVELCCWNDEMEWSLPRRAREQQPTADQPLVYPLFGQLDHRESLVLTEDNYFDYLIGVTKHADVIPKSVLHAWTDTALMFLGFRVDDWNFRVLFRSIMSQEGASKGKTKPHVAVQIDPYDGGNLDPLQARAYLREYLGNANVSIYWGSTEEFMSELWTQWQQHVGDRSRVGPRLTQEPR